MRARADPPPAELRLDDPPVRVAVRQHARARRLTLRLSANDGALTLTAPRHATGADVRGFLDAHRDWIAKRLAVLPQAQMPAPGLPLDVGDERLVLRAGQGRRVVRRGDELFVPGAEARFRGALQAWLKEQARARALEALDRHSAALGRRYAGLTLRDTRSRWGSCTAQGNIMLSWRLVLAPSEVLDYVAAHEVAHLAEMNHSPAYWRVLEGLMPQYAGPRDWLRTHGAQLHRYRF
ncbi:DUF45 domain-containing protein [Rhodobacteraceae bacterium 2CG4]|uniref:DUF45 domain-containing protein n=1 Tax=Halovulum marinum TaxID=2662447 RepID=A0A6L5Z0V3_9RHOB|nr:DUF45 domain-containing protein [Halovulum marinum]